MKRLFLLGLPLVAIAAGVAVVLARGSDVRMPLVPSPSGPYRGSEPPEGLKLPSFALRESDGRRFSTRSLAGKVVLVTFLETKCKEACPIIADHIGMGLE